MKSTFRRQYDSVQEFCTVKTTATNEQRFNRYVRGHYDDPEWLYGNAKDYAGLANRMEQGWHDGAERIRAIEAGEVGAAKSTKRKHVRADQGDSLDIHSVFSGNLDRAWTRTRREFRRSPATVRIVAVVAGSCRQKEAQFFYRGAAVAKLCDLLTEAGYNVEVVAACVAEGIDDNGRVDYCSTITMKHATAPLDLSNLAAVLCQQAFVRYYMFRSFGVIEQGTGEGMGWYGDADRLNELARESCDEANVKTVFMKYEVDSREAAQQWIHDSVAEIQSEEVMA